MVWASGGEANQPQPDTAHPLPRSVPRKVLEGRLHSTALCDQDAEATPGSVRGRVDGPRRASSLHTEEVSAGTGHSMQLLSIAQGEHGSSQASESRILFTGEHTARESLGAE